MNPLSKFAHRSKYSNKRVSNSEGLSFGSQLERAVYEYLKRLERINLIKDLKCQDRVKLTDAEIVYIADFRFFDLARDCLIWLEAKGFETPEWRIKRRLWISYGPGPLQIYKGSAKSFKMHEELVPNV